MLHPPPPTVSEATSVPASLPTLTLRLLVTGDCGAEHERHLTWFSRDPSGIHGENILLLFIFLSLQCDEAFSPASQVALGHPHKPAPGHPPPPEVTPFG